MKSQETRVYLVMSTTQLFSGSRTSGLGALIAAQKHTAFWSTTSKKQAKRQMRSYVLRAIAELDIDYSQVSMSWDLCLEISQEILQDLVNKSRPAASIKSKT